MKPAKSEPRAVGARVDWLTLSFRVSLDKRALGLLKLRAIDARKTDSPVPIELRGGHVFKLHAPARDGKWVLQNDACRLTVIERAPGSDGDAPGWGVNFEASGTALLALGYRDAIRYARSLADSLGDVQGARFGRTDLCVDVSGYGLRDDDRHSFVKQRRVKLRPHGHDGLPVLTRKATKRTTSGELLEDERVQWRLDGRRVVALLRDEDDGVSAEYYAGGTFSGFSFGSRTTITVRVYDKRHELRTQSADKRAAEEAWWRDHGWDGKGDVVRVEAEFRGEALDELKLRHEVPGSVDADCLADMFALALDGAWAYVTRKWLRLVRRGSPDVVQPRWRVVQEAVFLRAAAPRERVRQRGAAKAAQAQGACVSLLGALGQLPILWPVTYDAETGTVRDELRPNVESDDLVAEYVAGSPYEEQDACELALAKCARIVGERAMTAVVDYERERAGGDAKKALSRMWARQRAAIARFGFPSRVRPRAAGLLDVA